ncbi:antibiotic biosynthesis monooxygenase family protein [Curtobacterium sp. MCLR17_036]|uniref:putative quinol monooxygenase n=1 Tax=Curtobacterium sp. MCLR17_036 TaxID=2175620 RepID=UPI000DA7F867|nr:antibiotic biosynthesis monooxygenase family protein [Curtobacterium sp. MCLR17_036]WIE64336.1 antibiotic biosynthesis monooxygenase family protein [Curtobacterium sp. MCLR17_036]
MSITVLLEVRFQPEAAADAVETAVRQTLAQTASFPGNESLEVLVDDDDPTRMVVVESWTTAADHDAYVAWRATPEGSAAIGPLLAEAPVTRTFARTIPLG